MVDGDPMHSLGRQVCCFHSDWVGGGRVSPVISGYTMKLVLNRMEKEIERGRDSSVLESVMCYYPEGG